MAKYTATLALLNNSLFFILQKKVYFWSPPLVISPVFLLEIFLGAFDVCLGHSPVGRSTTFDGDSVFGLNIELKNTQ